MKKQIKRRIEIAAGKVKAQFVLKKAKIVNVFSHEIIDGDIAIDNGKIIGIGQYSGETEYDMQGKYVAPGLIDGHVHLESAMVAPGQFARAVVPNGTTTVIADPHEIANVCGLDGIRYMLDCSENLPLNTYFMLPSCVPATSFENAGAVLEAKDIKKLIDHERVLGLGEMMDYPSVIGGNDKIIDKIEAAQGKIIDGHGPGISGKELNAYVAAGIKTEHECSTVEEMKDRLALSMYILIREGSAARNLETLIEGVTAENARRCLFCTDDKHPEDILTKGHINHNLRLAVKYGLDPITAIQMATINAAECYGLKQLGAIAPGYDADLIVLEDLKGFEVLKVFQKGILVAENGKPLFEVEKADYKEVTDTVHAKPVTKSDLEIKINSDTANVIQVLPHSLLTKKVTRKIQVIDGLFQYDDNSDILKMAVIERHKATGNIGLGLVAEFGLKGGAIATTVAHDSHNLIVIGDNDADMHMAIQEVVQAGGGITICSGGKVRKTLALPIGGLMSDSSMEEVNEELKEMLQIAYHQLGVNPQIDPFMTLAFLALPVIPEIKLTDKGLFDVTKFSFIDIGCTEMEK